MSIIIAFEKNKLLGGYGDRIVGLISCKLISNLLNQNFYILWNKENIKEYFDYSKYDYELHKIKSNDIKIYDLIDKQNKLKKYLIYHKKIFTNKITKIYLNQEISQYLYKNTLFSHKNYFNDIFNCYKTLYTDIFKPTDFLLNKIDNLINNKKNIIGIQIRSGDIYMENSKNDRRGYKIYKNTDEEINSILLNINNYCNEKFSNYNIFLTSDYSNSIKIASKLWKNIIYCNEIIQHIDRKAIDNNISKIFIDNYILSQKTKVLFISDYSNYGRIAALSSIHDNIFNLKTQKLNKKNLLSKDELIFS